MATKESILPTPIIHLNGSGQRSLVEQAAEVHSALEDALKLMAMARPHGRDYYTSPDPDAFTKARDAHNAAYEAVSKISEEYINYALAIQFAGRK